MITIARASGARTALVLSTMAGEFGPPKWTEVIGFRSRQGARANVRRLGPGRVRVQWAGGRIEDRDGNLEDGEFSLYDEKVPE